MNKVIALGLFIGLSLVACKNEPKSESKDATTFFGESFQEQAPIAIRNMVEQLASSDSVACELTASSVNVCKNKGCWMEVADGSSKDTVFVEFKDYAFFMPKDIVGKKVILKGFGYKDVTSVEDLKHFAEDEGKSAEEIAAIIAPKTEIKFLASGVKLADKK